MAAKAGAAWLDEAQHAPLSLEGQPAVPGLAALPVYIAPPPLLELAAAPRAAVAAAAAVRSRTGQEDVGFFVGPAPLAPSPLGLAPLPPGQQQQQPSPLLPLDHGFLRAEGWTPLNSMSSPPDLDVGFLDLVFDDDGAADMGSG